jgi:hypothetical protein
VVCRRDGRRRRLRRFFGHHASGDWTVGYNWADNIASSFSCEVRYTDFEDGGFRYDATQHGLFTRLAVKFVMTDANAAISPSTIVCRSSSNPTNTINGVMVASMMPSHSKANLYTGAHCHGPYQRTLGEEEG